MITCFFIMSNISEIVNFRMAKRFPFVLVNSKQLLCALQSNTYIHPVPQFEWITTNIIIWSRSFLPSLSNDFHHEFISSKKHQFHTINKMSGLFRSRSFSIIFKRFNFHSRLMSVQSVIVNHFKCFKYHYHLLIANDTYSAQWFVRMRLLKFNVFCNFICCFYPFFLILNWMI